MRPSIGKERRRFSSRLCWRIGTRRNSLNAAARKHSSEGNCRKTSPAPGPSQLQSSNRERRSDFPGEPPAAEVQGSVPFILEVINLNFIKLLGFGHHFLHDDVDESGQGFGDRFVAIQIDSAPRNGPDSRGLSPGCAETSNRRRTQAPPSPGAVGTDRERAGDRRFLRKSHRPAPARRTRIAGRNDPFRHARPAPGPAGGRRADRLGFFLHPRPGSDTLTVRRSGRGGLRPLVGA